LLVVEEPAELVETGLGYSGVPAEVELGLGLDLALAERQQRLVAAVVGGPVGSSRLGLACSGVAAGSFDLALVGCFLLVLEHLPAVALLLVGPSLTAVDAGRVSQSLFQVAGSAKSQDNQNRVPYLVLSLCLSLGLLLLLQAMLCLLLLLLKMLWQIDRPGHRSSPHRIELRHLIHAIWHAHRKLSTILLC